MLPTSSISNLWLPFIGNRQESWMWKYPERWSWGLPGWFYFLYSAVVLMKSRPSGHAQPLPPIPIYGPVIIYEQWAKPGSEKGVGGHVSPV